MPSRHTQPGQISLMELLYSVISAYDCELSAEHIQSILAMSNMCPKLLMPTTNRVGALLRILELNGMVKLVGHRYKVPTRTKISLWEAVE